MMYGSLHFLSLGMVTLHIKRLSYSGGKTTWKERHRDREKQWGLVRLQLFQAFPAGEVDM